MKSFSKKNIFFGVVFLMLLVPVAVFAREQRLADSDDYLNVLSPTPNSIVQGSVTSSWRVADDEQSSVGYQLTLMNNTCVNRIGTISTGVSPSNRASTFSISWSSAGPIQGASVINDGRYCIQACFNLVNSTQNYSACNARVVTIRNHNRAPVITSTPPADRSITISQGWRYDVNARDADGDPITYRIASGPTFLSINSATGLITTNSNRKVPGTYTVRVLAIDILGARDSQQFRITVEQPVGKDNPPEDNVFEDPLGEPLEDPIIEPDPDQDAFNPTLSFKTPTKDSIFSGISNPISWTLGNIEGLSKIKLYYSPAGNSDSWKLLAELSSDYNNFTWDVSKIEDGPYVLQIELLSDSGDSEAFVSERFIIENNPTPGTVDKLMITGESPANLSEVDIVSPEISAKFVAPEGRKVEILSFKVVLDDQDILSLCEVNQDGFKCTLEEDLQPGAHKVAASVKDDKGNLAAIEWTFVIKVDGGEPAEGQGGLGGIGDILGGNLPLILLICCIALILLIVPWLLYSLWSRRREDDDEEDYDRVETQAMTTVVTPQATYVEEDFHYDQPEAMDPGEFTSYEDYFAAATAADGGDQPQTIVNYYPPEDSSSQGISGQSQSQPDTADMTDFYAQPDSNASSSSQSDSSAPSWLNPVGGDMDSGSGVATNVGGDDSSSSAIRASSSGSNFADDFMSELDSSAQGSSTGSSGGGGDPLPPSSDSGVASEVETVDDGSPLPAAKPESDSSGSKVGSYGYGAKKE